MTIRLPNVKTDRATPGPATVTIRPHDDHAVLAVRPLRSRRQYCLPLVAVAEYVVARVIRAEVEEAKKRPKRRRANRGLIKGA